jgi:hypothetical protein
MGMPGNDRQSTMAIMTWTRRGQWEAGEMGEQLYEGRTMGTMTTIIMTKARGRGWELEHRDGRGRGTTQP